MIEATRFVAAARDYVGVPFVHQGRGRGGLDCAGLVIAAARDCGLPVPPALRYAPLPPLALIEALLARHAAPIAAWRLGAVAQLVIGRRGQHLGVCAAAPDGTPTLIDAQARIARVAERPFDPRRHHRVLRFWQLHEVA